MTNEAADETVDWIKGAVFRTARHGGYNEREVDSFLDELVAAVRAGQPLPAVAPAFTRSRLRSGYTPREVDGFLLGLGIAVPASS